MKKLVLIAALFSISLIGLFFLWRSWAGFTDGMAYPRSEIHAAVLGDNIYVAGGIGLFRVLDSCEFYNIDDQTWDRCASLPQPLHHVAIAADETRVYASGGYIAFPFQQDSDAALFAFDPAINDWEELAKLPHPIGQHAMIHRNGILYLIGGQNGSRDLDSFWSYNLETAEWHALQPMPTARHSHATSVHNEKLYVTGGRSATLGTEISKIEVFDFEQSRWSTLPDMPVGRAGHGAFVRNGKLHVIGGESLSEGELLSSHDVFDLGTFDWTSGKPMAQPRHGFAVGDHPNSAEIYLIGGGAYPGFHTVYSVTGTVQKLP